jgi:hypothetical protein
VEYGQPSRSSAVFTLTSFVDSMLSKEHYLTSKQPDGLLFECRCCDCLVSPELASECLEAFQEQPMSCFPNVGHDSR